MGSALQDTAMELVAVTWPVVVMKVVTKVEVELAEVKAVEGMGLEVAEAEMMVVAEQVALLVASLVALLVALLEAVRLVVKEEVVREAAKEEREMLGATVGMLLAGLEVASSAVVVRVEATWEA